MTIEIRPLQPLDVLALDRQPNVEGQFGLYEPIKNIRHGIELQAMGPAWSAIAGDGTVLCCAGFGQVFADVQATAWAIFSRQFVESARAQAAVIRFMRARVAEGPWRRIEALCRAAWPAEGRWLERVGFSRVALLRAWGPQSEDYWLFERVS
ncbi:hypothetical protein [Sphingopyxis granuli]|uniref:hypothetical protein n=1 Tax=Sphingopyxis granuli TaxID=267128 RepID=UPI001BB0537E|nr:hypothetical protein [Sphingopyxis granuli]QUM73345.1 hypothetical protein ICN83_05515 [Sphingopyxis granuli]